VIEQRLAELVAELYSMPECGVGGPLHIVLDDGNIDDESIYFCTRTMREHFSVVHGLNGSAIVEVCSEIAEILLLMPMEQRQELYESRWGRR